MPSNSKEYAKEYYKKNKEKFFKEGKQFCECCNKDISKHNFLYHSRTTKHITNMAKKNAQQG